MTDEQKRDYLEAIRDKSPVVTDAETLAVALSNIGTMSPRLRKVYDDSAALLRAQKAAIDAAVAAERERDAAASKQAWVDVLAERCRQIEVEGWTPEHDDCHRDGSLAKAAYCYAWAACGLGMESPPPAPPGWPWAGTWWKPRDTRSNLVRAAALLLAEIDRLDRQAGEKT